MKRDPVRQLFCNTFSGVITASASPSSSTTLAREFSSGPHPALPNPTNTGLFQHQCRRLSHQANSSSHKSQQKGHCSADGCICRTLRGDLLEELVRLAQLQSFDYIIIESSGISEPEQVAETFDNRFAEQMSQLVDEGGEGLGDDMMKVLEQL